MDDATLGQLAGKQVTGPDGEHIGTISDVYEATDGSGGSFATVDTGLFGGGASFFPLDAAEPHGDGLVVPYSRSFIADAPRVGQDEELTASEEQRLFEHYSQSESGGVDTTQRAGVPGPRLREREPSEMERGIVTDSVDTVRIEREPMTEAAGPGVGYETEDPFDELR